MIFPDTIIHKKSTLFLGMEKEGFIRSIVQLAKELIDLAVISTDRNTQIKKLMATDPLFNWLFHQFDPWHMAKGLSKKNR